MLRNLIWIAVVWISAVQCEVCKRNSASCPDYIVLEAHEDYEDRMYPSIVWVSTSASGTSRNEVSRELITRLYGYLGGANDRDEQIDMMVPVRTAKIPSDRQNNYTMAIALPSKYLQDPPAPVNRLLTMEREPPTRYVVRSFSGMATEEGEWDRQAEMLKASVAGEVGINTSFYFRCVYDSPWTEHDRLNEIWLLKREGNLSEEVA